MNGYLLIEDAIEPTYLAYLNERLDIWEEKALQDFRALPKSANPEVRYDDILNQETSLLDLVVNPKVLPYIDEMVERPRLKSTWVTFKWNGGRTVYHSNHTPSITHNLLSF